MSKPDPWAAVIEFDDVDQIEPQGAGAMDVAPVAAPASDAWSAAVEFDAPGVEMDAALTDPNFVDATQTTGGFTHELPPEIMSKLKPEQIADWEATLKPGVTAQQLVDKMLSFGFNLRNADDVVKSLEAGTPINRNFDYDPMRVETSDGAAGSFARGVGDTASFGTVGKISAAAQAVNDVFQGKGDFSDRYDVNLDYQQAIEDQDEESHPYARITGQLIGGLAIPSGVQAVAARAGALALKEARAAGSSFPEAMKIGRQAAAKAAGQRMTKEGAAFGTAYGVGSGDTVEESVTGGVTGLVAGAVGGKVVGEIAGAVAPKLVDRAVAARAKPFTAAERVAMERGEVLRAARDQDIRILPQDIGGEGVGRATQGAAQSTFGTATVRGKADQLYNDFKARLGVLGGTAEKPAEVGGTLAAREQGRADRAVNAASETSEAVRDASGTASDMTGAGQVVQRGINRWMADTSERATALYQAVPIEDGAEAVVSNTRGFLRTALTGMRSNPVLGAIFENPRLRRYMDALTPDPNDPTVGRLSWQDLQAFRTNVGDMLEDPRLGEKIAPRQLRALYSSLTSDMEQTAQREGPGAMRAWRRANDYYDGRMKRINDTLSLVVGERTDKTPNEAVAKLESMLRDGSTGNSAAFNRVMRSIPAADAATLRATLVDRARGGANFDPKALGKAWGGMSERGREALLPDPALRALMGDAAGQAGQADKNPFAGMSGEKVFGALETMAENKGDSVRFSATMSRMSPEEAGAVRSTIIHRMGLANAGQQDATGEVFSIAKWLTRWNLLSDDAKNVLFGNAEMRSNMDDIALLAERVKASEKLAGHSNTGAINSFNATTGGLGAAAIALLTGHPIVAAVAAGPAVYQRVSAEVLTSQRMLNWLAKAPKKPNPQAAKAHVARLSVIARAEPAIAQDVLSLQSRLLEAFEPARLAAESKTDTSQSQ